MNFFLFSAIQNDTGALIYLSAGPDGEAQLVLPYGLFELGVDIKDKEGALARVNISTMMVRYKILSAVTVCVFFVGKLQMLKTRCKSLKMTMKYFETSSYESKFFSQNFLSFESYQNMSK